jgi:hypothetical protein
MLFGRAGRPGWDWHDDKKALRGGIKRVYVIGAGASACDPYGLPTFKTLAQQLCNFLNEPERKILVDAIYECMAVDLSAHDHRSISTAVSTSRLLQIWLRLLACFGIGRQSVSGVDFEEMLNRMDPRALQYLSRETRHSMSELLAENAELRGHRRDIALVL